MRRIVEASVVAGIVESLIQGQQCHCLVVKVRGPDCGQGEVNVAFECPIRAVAVQIDLIKELLSVLKANKSLL